MKNQFISFFFTLVVLIVIASCGSKNSNQQAEPSPTEQTAVDTTTGVPQPVTDVYQCPMKCEGEKTYDKPGTCPKCKMDLKKKDEHEVHEH